MQYGITIFLYLAGFGFGVYAMWLVRHSFVLFWLIALPSTFVHELAHFMFALVLNGKPSRISIFPKKSDNTWVMGYVKFEPSWYNGALIAMAPLIVNICLFLFLFNPGTPTGYPWWFPILCGFLVGGLVPSKTDWGIALRYPFGFLLLGLFFI